jgi:hypothetical protein
VLDELKTKLRKAGSEAAALIPLLPVKGRFSLDLALKQAYLELRRPIGQQFPFLA